MQSLLGDPLTVTTTASCTIPQEPTRHPAALLAHLVVCRRWLPCHIALWSAARHPACVSAHESAARPPTTASQLRSWCRVDHAVWKLTCREECCLPPTCAFEHTERQMHTREQSARASLWNPRERAGSMGGWVPGNALDWAAARTDTPKPACVQPPMHEGAHPCS